MDPYQIDPISDNRTQMVDSQARWAVSKELGSLSDGSLETLYVAATWRALTPKELVPPCKSYLMFWIWSERCKGLREDFQI
jgi:hypothetical protein